jgi:hypothetical protein
MGYCLCCYAAPDQVTAKPVMSGSTALAVANSWCPIKG